MTTVLLVHGTGGRKPETTKMYDLMQQELLKRRPDLNVVRCYWGDEVGAKLYANGASIPAYDQTRAIGGVAAEDYNIALWDQLYRDPFYELQLLGLHGSHQADFVPGQLSPGETLDRRLQALGISPDLAAQLEQADTADLFEPAQQAVRDAQAYADAISTATANDLTEYQRAIARAVVATMIQLAHQQGHTVRLENDAVLRDAIVTQIANGLGEPTYGLIGDWLARPLLALATWYGKDHRGGLSDAWYPTVGDVVLYQGTGDPVRTFIRVQVAAATPPVVVLAHSLGGVASVDLLIMEDLPQVELLVTVGSQASVLYEMNALHSLRFGQPLPDHFPRWVNIYDPRDFLSYIAAKVFPARPGGPHSIKDVVVDNRQPFPQAHSSYWTNPATWDTIIRELP
jgi:hypothetical protein